MPIPRGSKPENSKATAPDGGGVARHIPEPAAARHFLCGPGDFVDRLSGWLRENGVAPERIHSERFGKSRRVPATGQVPPDAFPLAVTESTLAARQMGRRRGIIVGRPFDRRAR